MNLHPHRWPMLVTNKVDTLSRTSLKPANIMHKTIIYANIHTLNETLRGLFLNQIQGNPLAEVGGNLDRTDFLD